ncbi:MAG: dethiobiotin synthase [Betaproteobacteria bacterium RIFCSPLOWO2_12_FULL_62_13]|nr:MAG: dethiobiotin synthase [Betaproteobacteria bacterium RIFCSPLOWO2_12_FULL_62_13]
MTHHGYFITGTDTGIGKTLVACALLHALSSRGLRAAGMKPVAAGAQRSGGELRNEDAERLAAASSVTVPRTLLNPYCFELPIAPHIAAREAEVSIELEPILRAYHALAQRADVVVVEGIGGFCVPLNAREDTADLAQRLALPVLLVVGMRLGCLNHALLTAQAIRAKGLQFAGWIANRIDPTLAAAEWNVAALAERLAAPLLGDIEFMAAPDPRRIAAQLIMPL